MAQPRTAAVSSSELLAKLLSELAMQLGYIASWDHTKECWHFYTQPSLPFTDTAVEKHARRSTAR